MDSRKRSHVLACFHRYIGLISRISDTYLEQTQDSREFLLESGGMGGEGWGNMEQIVDEAGVLYEAKTKRRKRKKRGVSIPIVTAASGARRSVQNSKGFLRGERWISRRGLKAALMFFLRCS